MTNKKNDLSFIEETVLDTVPKEFKELDGNATYSLRKTGSTRPNYFVQAGDSVLGDLQIVNVCGELGPGVRVQSPYRMSDYIRTSPIVKVEKTLSDNTGLIEIQFQTEGGYYTLRKFSEQ